MPIKDGVPVMVVRDVVSLRDYFAGQALNAVVRAVSDAGGHWNEAQAATLAYAFADAMLAERAK